MRTEDGWEEGGRGREEKGGEEREESDDRDGQGRRLDCDARDNYHYRMRNGFWRPNFGIAQVFIYFETKVYHHACHKQR